MVKITDLRGGEPEAKLTVAVPPRGQVDSLFTNGVNGLGFSPGPMTLVSGFFSEQGSTFSFSHLLAGAMVSPMAMNNGSGEDENEVTKGVEVSGYKRNRPVNLVVDQPRMPLENRSPLLLIPPGLSPSGLLTSPAFLSSIQSPFGMSHQQALSHVTAQASYMQMQSRLQHCSESAPNETSSRKTITLQPEPSEGSQSDKKPVNSGGQKPANDGYNWRKYGEKQVKTCVCPRSYYKCSHPNCPVKKKVERSNDGNISEIIYRGHHNHDPPQSRRGNGSSAVDDNTVHSQQIDSDSESLKTITIADDDNADDEPIAKRRAVADSVPFRQTTTESKIVVQTRSEVDLLDDGYKWRKYGQKIVKGNQHPRSYYRCTYRGCNVRKHVERSPADPMAVITTYEGKHDHELPTGRHSSNIQQQNKIGLDIDKKDEQIPLTLHLKQEQIAT